MFKNQFMNTGIKRTVPGKQSWRGKQAPRKGHALDRVLRQCYNVRSEDTGEACSRVLRHRLSYTWALPEVSVKGGVRIHKKQLQKKI